MGLKFSLKQLHEFEDCVKGFLQSVNVMDVDDIIETSLKQINKDPLIEHTL